jgi:hypothetical protein
MKRLVLAIIALAVGVAPWVATARQSEPPAARFTTHAGSQGPGSAQHCWPDKQTNFKVTSCTDSYPYAPRNDEYLMAFRGEETRFRIYWHERPSSVVLTILRPISDEQIDKQIPQTTVGEVPLKTSLTPTWQPDLKDGRYVVGLSADWKDPDPRTHKPKSASWDFGVQISGDVAIARTGQPSVRLLALGLLFAVGGAWLLGVSRSEPLDKRRLKHMA